MIEYKGKAPVNTRLNPIGPLEGKPLLAYYNSFVWATLVASGSVWVGRLKSPLAVKGLSLQDAKLWFLPVRWYTLYGKLAISFSMAEKTLAY